MPRSLVALSLAVSLCFVAACKGDPQTPEYWQKNLEKTRRAQDRVRVLDNLRSSPHLNASFLPMLHAQLAAEKSSEVKASLARTVGSLKDRSSVKPLSDALDLAPTDSGANTVNRELIAALAQIGDPNAAPVLLRLLDSKDNYTRLETIQALGALRSKEAVPSLIQLAGDESIEPLMNKKAIEALGRTEDARAVPVLVRMLTKERNGISFYVESSFSLFQIGKPAVEPLIAALSGKDAELQKWAKKNDINMASFYFKAAQVLGDLGDARAEQPLLERLSFKHSDPGIEAIVRMHAADALGHLRVNAAKEPLSALVSEPDPTVREAYVRALVQLGGRESLPALQKAATTGDWFARQAAIEGIAQLGDARELPVLEQLAAAEPATTQKECVDLQYDGCEKVEALVAERQAMFKRYGQRLEAAKRCGEDAACWAKALGDKETGVVERAALELSNNPAGAAHVEPLYSRLTERDVSVRLALIRALDRIISNAPAARQKVASALPVLEKQLADEKGSTHFAKVNEDLRRLLVKLQRS